MKSSVFLSAALVMVVAAPRAVAQEGRPIGEIVIKGLKRTNETVVRLAVQGVGIRENALYSRTTFDAAKRAILDKGLYAAVSTQVEDLPDRRVRVVFDVIENPVIGSIALSGVHVVPVGDILKTLETKPGEILNKKTLAADIIKIQRFYQGQGYRAIVAEEFSFDPKTEVLTIPVLETVVEAIEVQGVMKTQRNVVLRELQTKVGKPYNENILREDLSRLMRLGIFLDAASQAEPGSDLDKTKVTIAVQEQKTGQVGVSVGYSQQQRLTGTLSLNEQNFRGRAQGLDLQWTIAGGISRNSYEVGFSEPWIDKNNTSLGVTLYDRFAFRFNRILSNNFTDGFSDNQYYEERRGGTVNLSRPLTKDRFTRAFTVIRTEGVRANNLQQNYDLLSDDDIRNLRGSLVQNGSVSAVTFGLTANNADNVQDPSKGRYISPAIELGGSSFDYQKPRLNPAFISKDQTPNEPRLFLDNRSQNGGFAKYTLDLRNYFSLNGPRSKDNIREAKRVLATRLLVGTAVGNIAFSEQFFMGGPDNLRGFFDDRFWGNNQFLLSNELRIPFDKQNQIGGVLFLDIGDAWSAAEVNRENIPGFEQHRAFRPRAGFGFGLRIRTPVGPVRLDYGFGDGSGRSHFSIGQAF